MPLRRVVRLVLTQYAGESRRNNLVFNLSCVHRKQSCCACHSKVRRINLTPDCVGLIRHRRHAMTGKDLPDVVIVTHQNIVSF
jgi:uncharacterized cysteine cluster protein YcgN (CxxCxxCC family)